MDIVSGLGGLTRDDFLTLILCLPWVLIMLGRLVPSKRLDEVWSLYREGEATRRESVKALNRAVDAVEDVADVVKAFGREANRGQDS